MAEPVPLVTEGRLTRMVGLTLEAVGCQASVGARCEIESVDGNCIEASEHRIEELRSLSAGALPGKSLVVYDPVLGIPVDVFPCEDGHAQERSLLNQVLPTVQKGELWVADRNFCVVDFTCAIDDKDAHIVFRQHGNLPYTELGKERAVGKIETGKVFEQPIEVIDKHGKAHQFRRIRVLLTEQTRDGDKEIFIIANLPKKAAGAKKIANIYRGCWSIETSFQELEKWFNSEINTLDSYQFSFAQNAQNILHHLCKPKSCKRLQRLNLVSTFFILYISGLFGWRIDNLILVVLNVVVK